MEYRALPFAGIWNDGIFNVPLKIVDEYLKLASEYQLKALLYILRHNGSASTEKIAKALGQTERDTDSLLEFWVEEGIISADGKAARQPVEAKVENEPVIKKQIISAPSLTPKDIIVLLREDKGLQTLVNEAQRVFGRTISTAEQEIIINMVNYYGLEPQIVLMILQYYKTQKQKGLSVSFAYINAMAKNWSEEGIATIDDAEEKLREIEKSNRLWNEIVAITGIKHKKPTVKQREMILSWFEDFDIAMITLACDRMKESIPEPKLNYINSILVKWKKAGIKTPEDVKKEQEQFEKSKTEKAKKALKKGDEKLKSKPSYNLEQIKLDAMNNTDI